MAQNRCRLSKLRVLSRHIRTSRLVFRGLLRRWPTIRMTLKAIQSLAHGHCAGFVRQDQMVSRFLVLFQVSIPEAGERYPSDLLPSMLIMRSPPAGLPTPFPPLTIEPDGTPQYSSEDDSCTTATVTDYWVTCDDSETSCTTTSSLVESGCDATPTAYTTGESDRNNDGF